MGLIERITRLRTYKCYFPSTTNYKNQHNNQNSWNDENSERNLGVSALYPMQNSLTGFKNYLV